MKILLSIALVVLFTALSARGSYLYWQVDTTESEEGKGLSDALAAYNQLTVNDLVGARLVQIDADGGKTTVGAVGKASFNTLLDAEVPTLDLATMGKRYSYYIEYVSRIDQNYSVVATSQTMTYEALVNQNAVYVGSELSVPTISAWAGTSFSPAPEPTSALLLAFGLSTLLLRRKRLEDP